jgi:phosphate-selective porin OprO/OprP
LAAALGASAAADDADAEDELQVEFNLAPEFTIGDRSFKIIGRLQGDYTAADASLSGLSDSWSGSEIRRGRIGVEGEDGRISFRLETAFEESDALIEDAWINVDLGEATLIAGHWKVPVSLNEQTSSRHITSLERAGFTDAFGFGRRMGVGVQRRGERYTFKAGVFGDNVNDDTGAADESVAAAARLTFNPAIFDDGRIVHLGASARVREAADGMPFGYGQRPQIHISDAFIDAGDFAESDTFFGVEGAYVAGRLHLEGELATLDADGPGADATFQGGYLEGGFFLTREDSKGYRNGAFDRTRPHRSLNEGGRGAWEARGRLDWIDLDDGPTPGGSQTAYTVGLNWFATDYLRFLGEVTHAEIEDGPSGSGDVRSVSIRGAIDW